MARKQKTEDGRSGGAAFLLAQVGSHAAQQFASRLEQTELTPAHAGVLRILDHSPGITQQQLASMLGMVPSRLVTLMDELDQRGLTERRKNADDRRSHALHLTTKGQRMLQTVGEIAREHQRMLIKSLSDEEQKHLTELLQRIADEQELRRLVHPGYRAKSGEAEGQRASQK